MTPSNLTDHTDLPEPSPHDLAAATAGDREAFRRIVERYQGMVYSMAYNLLGNHIDAEDAAQEAFLRCIRSCRSFAATRPSRTWFFRLALNAIIDYQRRERSRRAARRARRSPTPRPRCCGATAMRRSRRRSATCPPTTACPLVLRDIYGLPYEEIADALDRPLGTVKVMVHRGRASLRLRLRASGAIDEEA